MPKRVTRSFK